MRHVQAEGEAKRHAGPEPVKVHERKGVVEGGAGQDGVAEYQQGADQPHAAHQGHEHDHPAHPPETLQVGRQPLHFGRREVLTGLLAAGKQQGKQRQQGGSEGRSPEAGMIHRLKQIELNGFGGYRPGRGFGCGLGIPGKQFAFEGTLEQGVEQ